MRGHSRSLAWGLAALLTAMLGMAYVNLAPLFHAAFDPPSSGAAGEMQSLLLYYSALPRLAMSLLAGAALGLAGALLQQALRNPLASPTTLGLSAGASLALTLATLFAPSLLVWGREWVAFLGSLAAGSLVLALGRRRGFSPVSVVLGGLAVSLYCGALASILILSYDRFLPSLFIWGSGALEQQDWRAPVRLGVAFAVFGVATLLLARPLSLLGLTDAPARSLGLSPAAIRWAGVAIALALVASVTSLIGVIGFVGLLAPALVRLSGARLFSTRLLFSPLVGAIVLCLTDQTVQIASKNLSAFIPTGAVTALIGAPLLLFLLPRLKPTDPPEARDTSRGASPARHRGAILVCLAVLLLALVVAAILFGRMPGGAFSWVWATEMVELLPWRWPRVVGALGAGALLAAAGLLLQRLTANEMASPEVLGISAGATLGLGVSLFVAAVPGLPLQLTFAGIGAFCVLMLILTLGWKTGFSPERVLLAGISLNALLDAGVGLLSATGDPRALRLLGWMAGSTYGLDATHAIAALILALATACLALAATRWLDILPLGTRIAAALGIGVARARSALFALAIAATAAGALVLGPLSFVGLMAPHLARELGMRRAAPQLVGAMLIGAIIMICADWVGRTVAYPYQLPAGLVSALVGTPVFILLLLRRHRG